MGKSLKGKELGKGISQRADGMYIARFTNRFGKRQYVTSKTYNEVEKGLREAKYEDEKQLNIAKTNMTLNEWFDVWISICKVDCRDTTKQTYNVQYNRLREDLGWRRLDSLNLVIIQNAFNKLKSDASRCHCKAILVDMLNRAMETELISKNVAINVKTDIDKDETKEKRILKSEEIDELYKVSKNSRMYPIFVVALNTGMRLGEILGLTWDCIDFENNMICVKQTLCYLPNKGNSIYELHAPKTKAGKRNIPMSKAVKEALIHQKEWRDKVITKFEPRAGFEDLVFISKTNKPLHESNIRCAIRYLIQKINLEIDPNFVSFTPHCLRHTFATNCIARGMKPKTLQKILGHNSLQMTMDLYCHVLDETIKDEMSIVMEMAN